MHIAAVHKLEVKWETLGCGVFFPSSKVMQRKKYIQGKSMKAVKEKTSSGFAKSFKRRSFMFFKQNDDKIIAYWSLQ